MYFHKYAIISAYFVNYDVLCVPFISVRSISQTWKILRFCVQRFTSYAICNTEKRAIFVNFTVTLQIVLKCYIRIYIFSTFVTVFVVFDFVNQFLWKDISIEIIFIVRTLPRKRHSFVTWRKTTK
jgi:hypothetical protein